MRRPRVATVLTSRAWEESFVAHARATGAASIVARAYRPEEVTAAAPDLVVVGEETAWLGVDVVGLWAVLGIRTVLVTETGPRRDLPSAAATTPSNAPSILNAIRESMLDDRPPTSLVSVAGPRGSGVTEIACSLARSLAPAHLIDRDEPAASLRLQTDRTPVRGVTVTPAFPVQPPELAIMDCGGEQPPPTGSCVLVVAHTPVSLVRAVKQILEWTGPVPDLVINMTRDEADATDMAVRSLGLEPRLLLPYDPEVARAAACGEDPPVWFSQRVASLVTREDARRP